MAPYSTKVSVTISRQDAVRLCQGDYGTLLDYKTPDAIRLYTMMSLGLYPACRNREYNRLAFTYDILYADHI